MRFWSDFEAISDATNEGNRAPAEAPVHFLRSRIFINRWGFGNKKHQHIAPKLTMLRQIWLQHRFQNSIKCYFNFWNNFWPIWARFGANLGNLWKVCWQKLSGSGGSWRGLLAAFCTGWLLEGSWQRFVAIWNPFSMVWARFCEGLGSTLLSLLPTPSHLITTSSTALQAAAVWAKRLQCIFESTWNFDTIWMANLSLLGSNVAPSWRPNWRSPLKYSRLVLASLVCRSPC